MLGYISVIIPVYNDQKGIDACLTAMATQTLHPENFEVIVVDNGSDPAITLDQRFENFARITHCMRPGSYAARNVGIGEARGTLLAFTDADCVPGNNWLKAGATALSASEGDRIIGGQVELFLSDRPTSVEKYQYLTTFMQKENIAERGFSATANIFFYRELTKEIGLFSEELLSGGDRDWCWRATAAGVSLEFCETAVVTTQPRRSLNAAIRQARRIAGGRHQMKRIPYATCHAAGLTPSRRPISAANWILKHPELSAWERIRIFWVAVILKSAHNLESIRLRFGGTAERS